MGFRTIDLYEVVFALRKFKSKETKILKVRHILVKFFLIFFIKAKIAALQDLHTKTVKIE